MEIQLWFREEGKKYASIFYSTASDQILIRKQKYFEENLQAYMVTNTNICHLLIIVIFYWSFFLYYAKNHLICRLHKQQ